MQDFMLLGIWDDDLMVSVSWPSLYNFALTYLRLSGTTWLYQNFLMSVISMEYKDLDCCKSVTQEGKILTDMVTVLHTFHLHAILYFFPFSLPSFFSSLISLFSLLESIIVYANTWNLISLASMHLKEVTYSLMNFINSSYSNSQ